MNLLFTAIGNYSEKTIFLYDLLYANVRISSIYIYPLYYLNINQFLIEVRLYGTVTISLSIKDHYKINIIFQFLYANVKNNNTVYLNTLNVCIGDENFTRVKTF